MVGRQRKGVLNEVTQASRKSGGRKGERRTHTCPDCRGQMVRHYRNLAGKRLEEPCKGCNGKGTI